MSLVDTHQLFSAGEVYPKAKAIRFREEDDLVIQAEYSVTGEYRPLSDQPVDICAFLSLRYASLFVVCKCLCVQIYAYCHVEVFALGEASYAHPL